MKADRPDGTPWVRKEGLATLFVRSFRDDAGASSCPCERSDWSGALPRLSFAGVLRVKRLAPIGKAEDELAEEGRDEGSYSIGHVSS